MGKNINTKIPQRPLTGDASFKINANEKSVYFGEVTFTGDNWGAWHELGDYTQARMCIAFKPIDSDIAASLETTAYQYPNVLRRTMYQYTSNTPDENGYYFTVSDYFNISPNSDMRLRYSAASHGGGPLQRRVSVHAWVDVK